MSEEPRSIRRMTAIGMTTIDPQATFVLRQSSDDGSPWKRVAKPVSAERWSDKLDPGSSRGSITTEVVVATFTDDTTRYFDFNDQVDVGWV